SEIYPGILWLQPPRHLGHSAAASRNFLSQRVETPLLFLCDDDQYFTPQTDLERMHSFLERSAFDLVAGGQGRHGYGAATFTQRGSVLHQRFSRHHGSVAAGVVACDRVENTFLARTDALRAVQ